MTLADAPRVPWTRCPGDSHARERDKRPSARDAASCGNFAGDCAAGRAERNARNPGAISGSEPRNGPFRGGSSGARSDKGAIGSCVAAGIIDGEFPRRWHPGIDRSAEPAAARPHLCASASSSSTSARDYWRISKLLLVPPLTHILAENGVIKLWPLDRAKSRALPLLFSLRPRSLLCGELGSLIRVCCPLSSGCSGDAQKERRRNENTRLRRRAAEEHVKALIATR